jgi:hypothetical protein
MDRLPMKIDQLQESVDAYWRSFWKLKRQVTCENKPVFKIQNGQVTCENKPTFLISK